MDGKSLSPIQIQISSIYYRVCFKMLYSSLTCQWRSTNNKRFKWLSIDVLFCEKIWKGIKSS